MSNQVIADIGAVPLPSATRARTRRSLAPVRAWLWTVAALIFAMVIVGGATRLTQSGLSITQWKPISGVIPPLTPEAWQAEFDRYKLIPQYTRVFPDMDLQGFKSIFYWEWAHRLLGRIIGVAFALPLAWFWLTGRLTAALKPRLLALLALGGLQGMIGWWMVKSGLSERVSVSQYRLAVHLLTASVTFAYAIWLAEGLRVVAASGAAHLRPIASALVAAVFLQLGFGALVAGLHAGLIYNTWPLMDGHFVPPVAELLQDRPAWTNLFENVLTVQFDHRLMAYLVLALAAAQAVLASTDRTDAGARRRALLVLGLVLLQVVVGITTLLLVVPLWAALMHQAVAMLVLGAAVVHRRRLGCPSRYSPAAFSA